PRLHRHECASRSGRLHTAITAEYSPMATAAGHRRAAICPGHPYSPRRRGFPYDGSLIGRLCGYGYCGRCGAGVTGFAHSMPFGAALLPDGAVRFRLWAPSQPGVSVILNDAQQMLPMEPRGDGWFELVIDAAGPGSRYRFQLP